MLNEEEVIEAAKGAKILSIESRYAEAVKGAYAGDFGAYQLIIRTDKGVLLFEGCHDSGGDLELHENVE